MKNNEIKFTFVKQGLHRVSKYPEIELRKFHAFGEKYWELYVNNEIHRAFEVFDTSTQLRHKIREIGISKILKTKDGKPLKRG